jgi:hypothetical protein
MIADVLGIRLCIALGLVVMTLVTAMGCGGSDEGQVADSTVTETVTETVTNTNESTDTVTMDTETTGQADSEAGLTAIGGMPSYASMRTHFRLSCETTQERP